MTDKPKPVVQRLDETEEAFVKRARANRGLPPLPPPDPMSITAVTEIPIPPGGYEDAVKVVSGRPPGFGSAKVLSGMIQISEPAEVAPLWTMTTGDGLELRIHGATNPDLAVEVLHNGVTVIAVPKDVTSWLNGELRERLREEIRSEMRVVVAADIQKLVREELAARQGLRDALVKAYADLKELGFDEKA